MSQISQIKRQPEPKENPEQCLVKEGKNCLCKDEVFAIDLISAALYNKGISLARSGKYDKAITCFDNALAREPNNANALYHKYLALTNLDKHNVVSYISKEITS